MRDENSEMKHYLLYYQNRCAVIELSIYTVPAVLVVTSQATHTIVAHNGDSWTSPTPVSPP